MKETEWTWNSSDGLAMFSRAWEPEVEPKAVVSLVHGVGEHIGRYAIMGEAFADSGFVLAGFDLRGHGRSDGPRGHVPSIGAYMDDIAGFLGQTQARYARKPQFLYGHSLGAILVLNYVLRRKPTLAGVISSAAALRTPLEEQKVKILVSRVLGLLMPAAGIKSGLDPANISRSDDVVKAYVDDPLVHDRVTLGFAKTMVNVLPWTFDHAAEFSLPLLVMHGTDDRLGYPRGSEEFADLADHDCTLKLWEGFFHELHNEPGRNQVFSFVTGWMNDRLKGS